MFDNVKVLQCIHFYYYRESEKVVRTVKDYEIDYYLSGSRRMNIDGKEFDVEKGSVVIRHPGEVVYSYGDKYDCYILSLDFSGEIDVSEGEYIRQREGKLQKTFDNPIINMLHRVITPKHDVDYLKIFENLCKNSYPNAIFTNVQRLLVSELMYTLAADSVRKSIVLNQKHKSGIDIASEYIHENYNHKITINKLSNLAHLSPNYFVNVFKKEKCVTPNEYIIRIRFENARVLLSETDDTVKSIASQCGFTDLSFFTYAFKKRFLKTPTQYRNYYKTDRNLKI